MRKCGSRPSAWESLESRHLLTGTIGLSIDLVEVQESDEAVMITLLRSGDLEGRATVDYTTVEDSAKETKDFTPRSGTFTFKPGVTGQQISIPITNDDESEPVTSFRFELSNPTGGAELGRVSQTIRILDDDSASTPLFSDNFERTVRWTINPTQSDSATSGQWEVASPQETQWNLQTIQPGSAIEGQRALVTGAARVAGATSNDVDGGITSALSPVIDLPNEELIDFSFSYYFGHAAGSSTNDYLRISVVPVTETGSASTQPVTVFEVLGTSGERPAVWNSELLDLSPFAGQSVQILIAANDSDGESIVEVGVDDVFVDVLPEAPGTISFANSTINVEEGQNVVATIELLRARGRTGEVSVEVFTADDGATANEDYVPLSETVTFADGVTSQTVTISIINDDAEEALENITVSLSNASVGAAIGATSTAQLRLVDDDRFLRGLLPDLVAMEDDFASNYIDMNQIPGRALYRFGTAVANSGDGPLEIWGGEAAGTTQEVLQRIYEPNGEFYDRLAGSFIYHAGHGHVHLEGFASFHLRAVEESGEVGDIVASGGKTSFCLLNITHPFPAITSASSRPHGRGGDDCNTVQGISVGHADVYGASLEGQWIDVTEIADGDYYLEVVADPDDTLLEVDETNNVFHAIVNVDNPFFQDGEFVEIPTTTTPPIGGPQTTPPEDAVLVEGPRDRTSGAIRIDGENDWYRFDAVAGTGYRGEVLLTTTSGPLSDSVLRLRDASGNELIFDDDGGEGLGSAITWTAPSDGVHYFVVGSLGNSGTGRYRFDFEQIGDDHGNNATNATALVLGEYTEGNIEFAGGADWFSFEATSGQHYQLDGIPREIDDVQIALMAPDGTTELLSVDDRNRVGPARAYWLAEESGTHFIRLEAGDEFGAGVGTYRVRSRALDAPGDDFANTVSGASPVALSAIVDGEIDYELDQDVFEIEVEKGVEYIVEIRASSTNRGELDEPRLLITDSAGTVLAEVNDHDFDGINVEWLADESGPRFFTVRAHDGLTGDYQFTVYPEVADTTADALVTEIPLSVTTSLHEQHDVDVFAFEAVAGTSYSIHTVIQPLTDTAITLFAPDGETVLATNDDESAQSLASRLNWTADQSGPHFVSVAAYNGRDGDYELVVGEGETTPVTEAAVDDYPNVGDTDAELLALYGTISGQVDYPSDEDWFRFRASSRRTYNVTFIRTDRVAEDTAEQQQPRVRVFNSEGELQFESAIPPGRRSTTLDFMPSASGQVYMQITDPAKGEYQLTIDSDDHGDNQHNARLAAIGTRISGNLEVEADSDWFRIEPTPGSTYRIRTFLGSASTSLGDSTLRIFDEQGIEQLYNDDADGLASELTWAPLSDAPFYFEVDGLGGSTGTYQVLVTEVDDDHGNSSANATAAELAIPIEGRLETEADVDWFAFSAEAGQIYRASATEGAVNFMGSDGSLIPNTNGFGFESTASLVAETDGTMFVQVSQNFGGEDEYEITIVRLVDVHGDSADAAHPINATFDLIDGDVELSSDVDWFSFQPNPGKTYRIDVTSQEAGFTRLNLIAPDGIPVASAQPPGFFWEFQPDSESANEDDRQSHFLQVSGTTGPYELKISELELAQVEVPTELNGTLTPETRSSWLTFSGLADTLYEVSVVAEANQSEELFAVRVFNGDERAPGQGTLQTFPTPEPSDVRIEITGPADTAYQVSIQEITPTQVEAPSSTTVTPTIGASNWFSFTSEPGVLYDVTVGENATVSVVSGGPESSPFDQPTSWFSTESEAVLLQVTSTTDDEYQLDVDVDIPDHIDPGNRDTGRIRDNEVAWYQFRAFEGASYRIETTLTTLSDSVLELFDPTGQSIAFDDDGGAESLASRIDWVATDTATFYFQVRGLSGGGRYRVTLEQTATPVEVIDAFFEAVRDPQTDPEQNANFDLDSDGTLTPADIDAFLTSANIVRGDIDLNGEVNFADFLVLSANFGFGQTGGWSDGDVTGDGNIDFADFLALSGNFGSTA